MSNVLIVEDDNTLRDALADTVDLAGHHTMVAESAEKAIALLSQSSPDIVISDVRMDGMDGHGLLKEIQRRVPGVPVVLITAHGTINNAVDAMRCGAVDYVLKPFEPKILIEKIDKYVREEGIEVESNPIAEDPKSRELVALALRVADTDATVLISGESGTGKEVLAHFIHDHSTRKEAPFVAINCAAIPEQMLEATLFGYEKGAFTGAYKSTPGKFEQAQDGTILLDEISEMDLNLQAKLLRVLQEREVERIGSTKVTPLNVRVLATTNRNMKTEVAKGRFREDLYYRLNVFPLHWIPLRERRKDIIPVALYLIERHWPKEKGSLPELSSEAENALLAYDWPGNAREMDNVIQRALILHSGNSIEVQDLQLLTEDDTAVVAINSVDGNKTDDSVLTESVKQHEFEVIKQVLEKYQGDRKQMANALGISERTLRYKLAKMREVGFDV